MSATPAARRLHGAAYNLAVDGNNAGRMATTKLRAMKDRRHYDADARAFVDRDGWTADDAYSVVQSIRRALAAYQGALREAEDLVTELREAERVARNEARP